jgi:hypothetical protein
MGLEHKRDEQRSWKWMSTFSGHKNRWAVSKNMARVGR